MTAVRGPDVSSYQGYPDWNKVKAGGFYFGAAKATEGLTYQDRSFHHNWAGLKSAGLVRIAYHFAHADAGRSPNSEASKFVSFVNSNGGFGKGDIPTLDIEAGSLSGIGLDNWIDQWCRYVEAKWRPGLIYSGEWFLGAKGAKLSGPRSRGWKLWTSAYGPRPTVYSGYSTWTFWQFTDGKYGPSPHSVPGIGNCDISIFNGSADELHKYAGSGASTGGLPKHKNNSRKLSEGATGTDVRHFQAELNNRLRARKKPKIDVDGSYGPKTEAAKKDATYFLGFPDGVVARKGATPKVQDYIDTPTKRPRSYVERAKKRKAAGKGARVVEFKPKGDPPVDLAQLQQEIRATRERLEAVRAIKLQPEEPPKRGRLRRLVDWFRGP